MKAFLTAAAGFAVATIPSLAQGEVTVTSLLSDGWEVEGVIPTNAGPGILLEKDGRLVMCFVAETPDSPSIKTQYCKPVE